MKTFQPYWQKKREEEGPGDKGVGSQLQQLRSEMMASRGGEGEEGEEGEVVGERKTYVSQRHEK